MFVLCILLTHAAFFYSGKIFFHVDSVACMTDQCRKVDVVNTKIILYTHIRMWELRLAPKHALHECSWCIPIEYHLPTLLHNVFAVQRWVASGHLMQQPTIILQTGET